MSITSLHATVIAKDKETENFWSKALAAAAQTVVELRVTPRSEGGAPGPLVFVDAADPAAGAKIAELERVGRAVFLIVTESVPLPSLVSEGKVDDVLVYPFRPLEVLGKVMRYQQLLMWDEVRRLNASFSELLTGLKDDVALAERLQKSKLPVRFPDIKGFNVKMRYLAGVKSGGDYLDLAESENKNLISMVLTDSSSYGLSSAVLSVLMRVAMKISAIEARSCTQTVRAIKNELLATLNDKDRLSLFYGVLSRKDYTLRYVNMGSSCAFYSGPRGTEHAAFRALPSSGEAMSRSGTLANAVEQELALQPEGRLVLLSDGFVDAAGGTESAIALLNRFRAQEPVDLLNELVFRVKGGLKDPEELPAQDCTAAVFDVDSRLIRLAP